MTHITDNLEAEKLTKEIGLYIQNAPEQEYIPTSFNIAYLSLDNFQINNVNKLQNINKGIITAEVTVGIDKGLLNINSVTAKTHWEKMILALMHREDVSPLDMTVALTEIKQDIRKVYRAIYKTAHIEAAIDDLIENYAEIEKEHPTTDAFEKSTSETIFPPEYARLMECKNFIIYNLRKDLFLNPDKRQEIDQHDLEGKFEQKIPYEIKSIRRIKIIK